MSPDELVGSRDGCRHSIAEGTADVPIRFFQQIFSARTRLSGNLLSARGNWALDSETRRPNPD